MAQESQEPKPIDGTAQDGEVEVVSRAARLPMIDRAVIVAGHPRSGTSALCKLLETDDRVEFMTDSPGNDRNPGGYYEDSDVVELTSEWINTQQNEWRIKKANSVLTDMKARQGIPAFKLLHLPGWFYWVHFIEDPIVVGIFRDPVESIISGWEQRLFTFQFDWVPNNNQLIRVMEHADTKALVDFERMAKSPYQVAETLKNQVDLDVDPGVIDPNLKASRASKIYTYEAHEYIYETLQLMERGQYTEKEDEDGLRTWLE